MRGVLQEACLPVGEGPVHIADIMSGLTADEMRTMLVKMSGANPAAFEQCLLETFAVRRPVRVVPA